MKGISTEDYINKAISEIDGWFSVKEGTEFYKIAKTVSSHYSIVEIGSWQGKSTVITAKGSMDGLKANLIAIDPHIGSEEHQANGPINTFDIFKENIKNFGVADIVNPIVKFSHDAVDDIDKPIGFLFIDGAHDYQSVKKDFFNFFPKVAEGGVIAFHDSEWTGVMNVLGYHVYSHKNMVFSKRVLGTTIFKKDSGARWTNRLRNRFEWLKFSIPLKLKFWRRKLLGKDMPTYT